MCVKIDRIILRETELWSKGKEVKHLRRSGHNATLLHPNLDADVVEQLSVMGMEPAEAYVLHVYNRSNNGFWNNGQLEVLTEVILIVALVYNLAEKGFM